MKYYTGNNQKLPTRPDVKYQQALNIVHTLNIFYTYAIGNYLKFNPLLII